MRVLALTSDKDIEGKFLDFNNVDYEVTISATVMSATVLVEEFNPRVVFVDLKARGVRDFARWLKKETGCSAIALTDKTDKKDSPVTGFDGWLGPPFSEQAIVNTLIKAGIQPNELQKGKEDTASFWDITSEIRSAFHMNAEEENIFLPFPERGQGEIHVINQEVISIWGAKGGVGRTTLSLSLSKYLSTFDVLLIDLNFKEGLGDVNAVLDLPTTPHLGKLIDAKSDRRQGFLDSLIKPKNGSFAIIQPPPTIDQSEQINPDDIVDLIDQARRCFQIIIVDLPSDLSPLTLEAIDLSTVVLFVSNEDMGSLARIESIKSFVRKDIVKALVLNMFEASSHKAKEFAYFLDMPLAATLPDYRLLREMQKSGNIKKDCDSIVNKGTAEIVEAVFGIEKGLEHRRSISRLLKSAISNIIG